MKTIAIIVARGGSKRIPRKNIKDFLGHPIIVYSIEAALSSHCFDEVMVSTDDKEIADIARSSGANVPFYRSQENSSDRAMTIPVLEEVIAEYKKRQQEFELLCCIYPTAPFITADKLRKAKEILVEKNVDAVVPIVRFSYPIQRALRIEGGFAKMFLPENYNVRSQDLEPAYHDCGQFYFMKTRSMLEQKVLFPRMTIPFEMPETEVQDIDNEEDWKLAEMKYKIMRSFL